MFVGCEAKLRIALEERLQVRLAVTAGNLCENKKQRLGKASVDSLLSSILVVWIPCGFWGHIWGLFWEVAGTRQGGHFDRLCGKKAFPYKHKKLRK
jgi:hypothetical protein